MSPQGWYALSALAAVAALAGACGFVFFAYVLSLRVIDAISARRAPAAPPTGRFISPDPCGFCLGTHAWHDPGCGWLDRQDAPRLTHQQAAGVQPQEGTA